MERTRRKHEGQLCHDVFRRNSILLRSSPSHLLLVFLPSVISLLQTQIFHSCRGSQKASATTTRLQDAPAREIKILPVGDISPHEMASGMSSFLFLSPILLPPELPPISMQKGLRVTIAKVTLYHSRQPIHAHTNKCTSLNTDGNPSSSSSSTGTLNSDPLTLLQCELHRLDLILDFVLSG